MTADRCSEADAALRARAVAAARGWIGTPYCHQASCRGAGADCLGLLRGVWRELFGHEPEPCPAYTAAWSEISGEERLLAAARRHLLPICEAEAGPGDVALFRMRARGPAKHVALIASGTLAEGTILHAYSGHSVCETALTPAWRRRIAGLFRFPRQG